MNRPRAVSSQEAPGAKAQLTADGLAIPPADAPDEVKKVIAAANEIATKPYRYGGGHGSWKDSGYDCSGSVSYALHGGGLLDAPDALRLASPSWGEAGRGRVDHDLRQRRPHVHGRRRSAVRHERPLEGRFAVAEGAPRSSGGFTVRHPEGL